MKFIFERSGLNQWNANGRKRDFGEIYIPIPAELHKKYPNFFPPRDEIFNLQIPTGDIFFCKSLSRKFKGINDKP